MIMTSTNWNCLVLQQLCYKLKGYHFSSRFGNENVVFEKCSLYYIIVINSYISPSNWLALSKYDTFYGLASMAPFPTGSISFAAISALAKLSNRVPISNLAPIEIISKLDLSISLPSWLIIHWTREWLKFHQMHLVSVSDIVTTPGHGQNSHNI